MFFIVGSKPSCSRGASREENEMTCEEYSVYLQEIVKNRRHGTSPVKSPSLRHKEEILLTSLRGKLTIKSHEHFHVPQVTIKKNMEIGDMVTQR